MVLRQPLPCAAALAAPLRMPPNPASALPRPHRSRSLYVLSCYFFFALGGRPLHSFQRQFSFLNSLDLREGKWALPSAS